MTDTDKRPLLYDPMPRKDIELPPRMPEADTIARLTAELAEAQRELAAALAGAVEVRPLEFSIDPRDGVLTSRETGQLFRVFPQADGTFFAPKLPNPGPYATAEEPIALLNEQHRTRTLAALHPSPDALQAVTANG